MVARKMRTVLVALSVAVLGASPSQSDACCFWRSMTTANYAPAPVCNTCNYPAAPVCNTCNYVPQVAYRMVYTNVPVTALRPISTVNPCTGCASTMMQPVTTYRLQPQLVPYTTYRPVMSACGCAPTTVGYAPACATGACGTGCATGACGTAVAPTAYYAPAATYAPAAPVAPAAPGCCGGGSTFAPTSYAPAASGSYGPAASTPYIQSAPSAGAAPGVGAPSLSPNPSNNSSSAPAASPATPATPRTFRDAPSDDNPPNFKPTPIPDVNTSTGTQRSNMVIPRKRDLGDLTTSNPVTGSAIYRQTSAKVALPASTGIDDGGWRAAR